MGSVVILGVFVADTSFRADRPPQMGETILGRSFALGPGGKGSNQAVAAARAGAEVHFVSKLGRDTFADMALEIWRDAGVRPAVTQHDDAYTGAAYIFIEEATGNNAIIICPGVASTISPADVEANAALIGAAKVFITQLEQPMNAALRGLQIARAGGARTILNPAPAADIAPDMLRLCDYVTPNETETEAITGVAVRTVDDAIAAAARFHDMGVPGAVITLGEAGVLLSMSGTTTHIPAFNAGPLVETTGAGDAFNGGFAAALARGQTPIEAARFGSATAGLSVTRAGTAPSMPTLSEIEALLATTT